MAERTTLTRRRQGYVRHPERGYKVKVDADVPAALSYANFEFFYTLNQAKTQLPAPPAT